MILREDLPILAKLMEDFKKKIKSKGINMQMSFLATVQKYTVDLAVV